VIGTFPGEQPDPIGTLPIEVEEGISFFVPGKPLTAGSKSAIPGKGPGGRPLIVESGNRQAKRAWRDDVRQAAMHAIDADGYPLWSSEALEAVFVFVAKRPSGQLRSGRFAGQLHPWALDRRPTTRPDALKLARAAEDALTGIVYADDAQIVDERQHKVYGDQAGLDSRAEGLLVSIRPAQPYAGPMVEAELTRTALT
jgi:hypothetical protein